MRYLRVLGIFYKAAILTDLEYRTNVVAYGLLSIIGGASTVGTMAIFFTQTDHLGDWTFHQALIVLGLFQLFVGLTDTFVTPNVQDFTEHLRLGTFDFILTKPLNSQFHASLRRINIFRAVDVLIGLGFVLYATAHLPPPPVDRVLMFVGLIVCAAIILYSLIMLLITSAFWFVQLENVMELIFTFYEAGRFPVSIFPTWMRILLTAIVPIAFITTVPASVLLGRLNVEFVLYSIGIAAILFIACASFWRYAVRHYSSASS